MNDIIVIQVNASANGGTGRIMNQIHERLIQNSVKSYISSPDVPNYKSNFHIKIGNKIHRRIDRLFSRFSGYEGVLSILPTYIFTYKMNKLKINLIHLHNIHGWFINFKILFKYIKKNNIKVIWTLHDAWSFTGHCPNFLMVNCNKWKTGCNNCPQLNIYPEMYVDRTKEMYNIKKKIFTSIDKIHFVTPSKWLNELLDLSYYKGYDRTVIPNGIDLNLFKKTQSSFRSDHKLENKIILLGVSITWNVRKGLDTFAELSKLLDNNYQIVLVGINKDVKRQIPHNIITIEKTENIQELSKIYSASDYFINPTKEDNFPTVNLEALACGLPVISFKSGGSVEMLDSTCGVIIENNDIGSLVDAIKIPRSKFKEEDCIKKANFYSKEAKFDEYIDIYNSFSEKNLKIDYLR
jgi:glycosyltransferase involved in cell wall biosynthesis